MTSTVGLNVLAQFVSDKSTIRDNSLRANSVLIMDDWSLAIELQKSGRYKRVIHRSWHPRDAELYNDMTAVQFLNTYSRADFKGYVQVLNEPNGYGDVSKCVNWLVEVVREAARRGVKVVVGNLGVGHPEETYVGKGYFDPLIIALIETDNYLGLHEYFQQDPTKEPYRTGRFKAWINRARVLRPTSNLKIIITEFGRDVAGGVNDGWLGNVAEPEYARLVTQAAAEIYDPYDIDVLVFCAGDGGGGSWRNFNVMNARLFLEICLKFNFSMFNEVPVMYVRGKMVKCPNNSFVNVRELPSVSSAQVGTLNINEEIEYANLSNGWFQIKNRGYVSAQNNAVAFLASATPPTPVPATYTITAAQLKSIEDIIRSVKGN